MFSISSNYSLLALITVLFISLSQSSYANGIVTDTELTMPDISWQDTEGNTHHLKDSNGKPRLLHFWAAWCFPCRTELPEMLKWKKENSDIPIIPLSLDDRMAQAKYFIKKYKIDMPVLLIDKDDSEKLDIPALPYTIFITADGSYSGHFFGIAPWQDDNFSNQIREHFKTDLENKKLPENQITQSLQNNNY